MYFVFPEEVQKTIDAVAIGIDHNIQTAQTGIVWSVKSGGLIKHDLSEQVSVMVNLLGVTVRGYGTVARALGHLNFLKERRPNDEDLIIESRALEQVRDVLDAARKVPEVRLLY